MRPHLDYCDVIYNKPLIEKIIDTLELIQYNGTLTIFGAIKGRSTEKLRNELNIEYLKYRQWMRILPLFNKIYTLKLTTYLYNLFPLVTRFYVIRNNTNVVSFNCRAEFVMKSFLVS